ncbi:hypothetical protein BDN72DRAFT_864385 [Pluteus cervinus]|uniref:Uncharacterized protein n=1 Tax=Pluteus cervinus TaxID=181527 RepID=A0ACD3A4V9_9AGAR|nr:hypothetical protein BDN72DRAFT_864385 [Pluteus cervinus]
MPLHDRAENTKIGAGYANVDSSGSRNEWEAPSAKRAALIQVDWDMRLGLEVRVVMGMTILKFNWDLSAYWNIVQRRIVGEEREGRMNEGEKGIWLADVLPEYCWLLRFSSKSKLDLDVGSQNKSTVGMRRKGEATTLRRIRERTEVLEDWNSKRRYLVTTNPEWGRDKLETMMFWWWNGYVSMAQGPKLQASQVLEFSLFDENSKELHQQQNRMDDCRASQQWGSKGLDEDGQWHYILVSPVHRDHKHNIDSRLEESMQWVQSGIAPPFRRHPAVPQLPHAFQFKTTIPSGKA